MIDSCGSMNFFFLIFSLSFLLGAINRSVVCNVAFPGKNIFQVIAIQVLKIYLRNEFDFWNVHGIMYTSGLLQSK